MRVEFGNKLSKIILTPWSTPLHIMPENVIVSTSFFSGVRVWWKEMGFDLNLNPFTGRIMNSGDIGEMLMKCGGLVDIALCRHNPNRVDFLIIFRGDNDLVLRLTPLLRKV